MNRVSSWVFAKGIELLLLAALVKTFATAKGIEDVWTIFSNLPEMSQIGVIACVAVSFGILATSVVAAVSWIINIVTPPPSNPAT